jgi:hypothetical protein
VLAAFAAQLKNSCVRCCGGTSAMPALANGCRVQLCEAYGPSRFATRVFEPARKPGLAAVGFRPSCICTRNYPDKREESSISQIVEGHKRRRIKVDSRACHWSCIAGCKLRDDYLSPCNQGAPSACITFELYGRATPQQPAVPISQQPQRRRSHRGVEIHKQSWHACSRCSPRPQHGNHRSS